VTGLLLAFALMAGAVAIHLLGGILVVMYLSRQIIADSPRPVLQALWILISLFAALLLLHLMQVSVWALLYWWRIGWDFNTAFYFSTTTYATIGYGDVVPPPEWRLVAVTQGLTGVLMLGWSSALVFAEVMRLFQATNWIAPRSTQ
jgi:hypothetical protein